MERVRARVFVIYGVLFLIVLYLVFSNNVPCLLYGLDGTTWLVEFEAQAARDMFSQLGSDPLQGNFDAYNPVFREYFLPETLSLLFSGTDPGKPFLYTTYGFLMGFATYVLARSVGFSRTLGFFSGSSLAAIAMPTNFSYPFWIYGMYNIVPQLAQVTAVTSLIIACFWAIDSKRRLSLTLFLAATSVALVVLSVMSGVTLIILMLPAIAMYGGASLFASKTLLDAVVKVAVAIACVVIPIALGMAQYAIAVEGYTAYHFFGHEFMQSRASFSYASVLYNPELLGKALLIMSVLGAAAAAYTESGKLKIFAWTHLLATLTFQIVAASVIVFASDYHGVSPLYFELMTWPVMAIFSGYMIAISLILGGRAIAVVRQDIARRWKTPSISAFRYTDLLSRHAPLVAVPILLASWNFSFASHRGAVCEQAPFFPITRNAITEYLTRFVATRVGVPFQGLAVTFSGVHGKSGVDWLALHASDAELWRKIGNDLRLVGLWRYNIPTLMQYSPLITPPYYVLLTDFLSRPADKQVRSVLVLTQPNEPMLQLWGVRFVITDYEFGSGEVRAKVPVPGQSELRLNELPDPNLGNYSPVEVRTVESFRDGMELMHEPSFDGRHTIVIDRPLAGPLVPATNSEFVYQKSGFTVTASSTGQSVLVLPVQYSRCWSVSGEGKPVLFRANMMQLGVNFTGRLDAKLIFRFGPLFASNCRLQDINDMERLNIREARTPNRYAQ